MDESYLIVNEKIRRVYIETVKYRIRCNISKRFYIESVFISKMFYIELFYVETVISQLLYIGTVIKRKF